MVYVEREGIREGLQPAALSAEGGSVRVSALTPIGLRQEGPFEPLATALAKHDALRDELAAAIPIPSLRHFKRVRLGLLAAAVAPMGMLLELDRELVTGRQASSVRVLVDLVLVAFVLFELTRRTPRLPGVCATALVAIGLRWSLVPARFCGHDVSPLVYLAAAVPFVVAGVVLAVVPSRARVALELAGKLGITRSELFAATSGREPPAALVAAAVGCAAGLPAVLHLTRLAGAGVLLQALAFVGFAAIAPAIARRAIEPDAPRNTRHSLARVLLATAAGLALTAAAVTAARLFFDVGVEIARCVERLDAEAKIIRATESAELARAIAKVRAETILVILTATVFPFAEERIYRGLLQDVLTRKYGPSYAVFAASIAFGVAHIGIYHVALYQTVLLGVGFGVAYIEGGILTAFLVHATWNLLQLVG